jgi:hypothetical protein
MEWPEIIAAYPFLKPLLDILKPVIGDAYNLLLSGIRTKQKAAELLTLTDAIAKAQRTAPDAAVSVETGGLSIAVPAQRAQLMLSPESEMRLMLDQRRHKALGGAVAEAAFELKDVTTFPNSLPDEDWVARYVEAASQVSDQKMQEVWGRILAGEIKKPGTFSLRTLHVVTTLSKFEAEYFERYAKHVVKCKYFGFIPVVENSSFLTSKDIGFVGFRFLADWALADEMTTPLDLLVQDEDHVVFEFGKNRIVVVPQKSPPVTVPQLCWTLTTAGFQLLELIEREAEPENIQLLVDVFRRFGLEPEVGSYVLTDGGKNFTPDVDKTEFSGLDV